MAKFAFSFTEEKNRVLKAGNKLLIPGVGFTGRDAILYDRNQE